MDNAIADEHALRVRHPRGRSAERARGRRRRFVVFPSLFFSLATCADPGTSVDDIRDRGFLRAGYSDEAPYAFVDPSGEVTGESPDALRGAAAALDIDDIRWIRLDFSSLLSALDQGRIDVVAAGMYRTVEREGRARFTQPTSCSGPALALRTGDDRFRDLADLRDTGSARVAVLPGSVEEAALRALGLDPDRLVPTPDVLTALVAVERGAADVIAINAPTALWLAGRGDGAPIEVRLYRPPNEVAELLVGCSALAFRLADERLAAAFDSALPRTLGSPERRRFLEAHGFSAVGSGSGETRRP